MPIITTFKDMWAAKEQVGTLKSALATLKTLGFKDLLGNPNFLLTTFLLVDLEGKIPMEEYTMRMNEKERLIANNKSPNIDIFTKCYEKVVGQQAAALYIRKQLEEVNFPSDHVRKPRRRRKNQKKNTSKDLFKTDVAKKTPRGSTRPMKGKFKNTYFIFEEVRGHGTGFCLNNEF